MRNIYRAADTIIDNNLSLDPKGMATKIGTGISRFATQDNAGVVDTSGDTVELINLSKGEATIYNFQNVEQKLSASDVITKGTQIYDLISESIRINWRINNPIVSDKDKKNPKFKEIFF